MDEGRTFQVTDHLYAIWFPDGSIIWIEEIPEKIVPNDRAGWVKKSAKVRKPRVKVRHRESNSYPSGFWVREDPVRRQRRDRMEDLVDRSLGD